MVSHLADVSVQTKIVALLSITDMICDTSFDDGHDHLISQTHKLGYFVKGSIRDLYVVVGKEQITSEVASMGRWHCWIPWLRWSVLVVSKGHSDDRRGVELVWTAGSL